MKLVTDAESPSTPEPERPVPSAPLEPRRAPEISLGGGFAGGDEPRSPWLTDRDEDSAPLLDPYLHAAAPAPQADGSSLAASALLAALLLGPVGAILAIVFGWYARQQIERAGGRRSGHVLATLAMVLGVALTMVWGGALSYLAWTRRYSAEAMAAGVPTPVVVPPEPFAAPRTAPPVQRRREPVLSAPQHTKVQREGQMTVVDVGVETPSLAEELARQRAEASADGETVLVMTTAGDCAPCRGVDSSLRDPLMQTALAHVRLVRVDLYVFGEDLEALKMPHDHFPGFFLLALDLLPRDGIDGGEWGDDIAPNIAPVLGAFVRGKYAQRKEAWKPVTGSGMSL
jgi:hypothetical protein